MKIKIFFILLTVCFAFGIMSCSGLNPFNSKNREMPSLYPIVQSNGEGGRKFGYINIKGEIVIEPQFKEAWFFHEGLAMACIEYDKCGYIDETGKFIINPQFQAPSRFSEGLAMVRFEGKIGYIDETGKFVINPQFQTGDIFSEGLAGVRIGDKLGYVNKDGKIIINPQFDDGLLFMENLAAVKMGGKWGFIDKNGKIIINPQFEEAYPFVNGLAGIKVGNQWGFVDKNGKIVINPQFDSVVPFAEEGIALVFLRDKAGYIDKDGKYIINPQYSVPRVGSSPSGFNDQLVLIALAFTSDLGKLSFSNGRALVNVGDSSPTGASFGYADDTGKIVINPQFKLAFPFYGDLALVALDDRDSFAWIDKEGKIVWRETKETPKAPVNTNTNVNLNSRVITNTNAANSSANEATEAVREAQEAANSANVTRENSPQSQRTGRLTTDSNLRSEANKDAASLGIHFKGAKVNILDETSFNNEKGELSTWYKIHITEYGCSVNTNLGCGKNNPSDLDEGWVNAKNVLLD